MTFPEVPDEAHTRGYGEEVNSGNGDFLCLTERNKPPERLPTNDLDNKDVINLIDEEYKVGNLD